MGNDIKYLINMINLNIKKKCYIVHLILFAISGYISFGIINLDYVLAYGDIFIPVSSLKAIKYKFTSYCSVYYLGSLNIGTSVCNLPHFPYHVFYAIFKIIGIKLSLIQRLWIFTIILLSLESMYILAYYLLKNVCIALITALFYIFNPFILTRFCPLYEFLICHSLLPFSLLLSIKIHKNPSLINVINLALLDAFFIIGLVNVPTWLVFISLQFLYIVFASLISSNFKEYIYKLLILFSLILLIYLPFLFVIYLPTIFEEYIVISVKKMFFNFVNQDNTLSNVLLLKGYWAFDDYAFHSPYFPYNKWFYSFIAIILGISILIMSSISLFTINGKDNFLTFLKFIFIISLFLSKGPNPPLSNVFIWCYDFLPYFWMFREPWTKFMFPFTLSYSLLLGYSLNYVYKRMRKIHQYLIISVIGLVICIYSWPFFSGDVFPGDRGLFPGMRVEIPKYWFEASGYINDYIRYDGRILLLPSNPFYQMHYFWWGDGYYGIDPTPYFIFKPLIYSEPGGGYVKPRRSDELINIFYQTYLGGNYSLWKFLALMNVKYILHRKDLDWTHIGTVDSSEDPLTIKRRLEGERYIHLIASFGEFDLNRIKTDQWFLEYIISRYPYLLNESVLDFYEVDNNYTLPHIFSSSKVVVVHNLSAILSNEYYDPRESTIIMESDLDRFGINFLLCNYTIGTIYSVGNYRPAIVFRKVNPTKYIVSVMNASDPFILVFAESYHPLWRLYIEDKATEFRDVVAEYPYVHVKETVHEWAKFTPEDILFLFRQSDVEDSKHFIVNYYANAWYIDPKLYDKDGDGKFTIVIYFWPQSLFYLGVLASVLTILFCLCFLLFCAMKHRFEFFK